MDSPTPRQLRAMRAAAGHTQTEAARVIYSTLRTWQDWEGGKSKMHKGLYHLYKIKIQRQDVDSMTDAEAWHWLTSNATQLSFSGGRCTVTVSVRGAERTCRHHDPKTAIHLADAALRGAGL